MENNLINIYYERFKNFLPVLFTIIITVMIIACKHGPDVPHTFTSASADSCRVCHLNGDNGAPAVSHPQRMNCLKCHDGGDNLTADNSK